jgi:hypothetical protein
MMNKNATEFIALVKDECKKHGIKCKLKNTSYVKLEGDIKCSGYFDETGRELVVSMNRKDSLEILVHEYAHMTQWLENCEPWRKGLTSIIRLQSWLMGEDVLRIRYHVKNCINLELDNEKRSVNIIKKYNLPVNITKYKQKANAYLYFYGYLIETRKWSKPSNSPYKNNVIVKAMPKRFVSNYLNAPEKIIEVFRSQQV